MKNILVTGATGFIGINLLKALNEKKYNIYILDLKESIENKESFLSEINVEKILFWDEIENEEYVNKIKNEIFGLDCCIHLAAVGVNQNSSQSNESIAKNINLMENLVKFCKELGIKRIINTGSGFEYGNKGNKLIQEDDVLEPFNFYGVSKATSTMMGQILAFKYNIEFITLRLFNAYGLYDNETKIIPYLVKSILKNEIVNMTLGEQNRDYIYIADIIEAYMMAIEKETFEHKIFNVCTSNSTTIKNIAELIAKQMDRSLDNIRFGAIHYRKEEPNCIVGSYDRIYEELGWSPKYDINEGIKEVINYFKMELSDGKI